MCVLTVCFTLRHCTPEDIILAGLFFPHPFVLFFPSTILACKLVQPNLNVTKCNQTIGVSLRKGYDF